MTDDQSDVTQPEGIADRGWVTSSPSRRSTTLRTIGLAGHALETEIQRPAVGGDDCILNRASRVGSRIERARSAQRFIVTSAPVLTDHEPVRACLVTLLSSGVRPPAITSASD